MRDVIRDKGRLEHILESIDFALEFALNVAIEEYKANNMMRFAVAKIKKTEKIQLLNTQLLKSGTKIKKGIYYMIERNSDGYTNKRNFLETLTYLHLSDSIDKFTNSHGKVVEVYTDLADFLKTITLEEVNTPTRTRIEKQLNTKK